MFSRCTWSRALALTAVLACASAPATTINQNTSWTLQRPGSSKTFRVVAYGDSLYAGYNGSLFSVAKRAAPLVDGEYLASEWKASVEVVRRARSGARADDVYTNKILAEKSFMQASNTRGVTFEMCGNDYLQARTALTGQRGTCDFGVLDTALAQCTLYTEKAMQAINQYAPSGAFKVVANLYYPGFAADDVPTTCTDTQKKKPVNKRARFLPYLVRSNWRTCHLAEQYGFACADVFAEFMAADTDTNGDGRRDSEALRYVPGESESAYVTRITQTLGATLRDANTHLVDATTSYDYLQSDDVHPTHYSSASISLGFLTGTGSGAGAPDFADTRIVDGKNPQWNAWGHERMGWKLSDVTPGIAPRAATASPRSTAPRTPLP
ncbi:SGNH/GDSL hydrolase family protein [Archangium primigenium]|uniref:SGNH/GDSL hydrolase family protein n=1 Tax=[Archangium] primigenium TaxID=2792470 RepID=UPI0019590569|nr:SGNH/GDSL hydrolase family protein [Archangium primigenium]MBM7117152.1 SGNH/GDSL hydrolase family protein [Archangium primigenium]